MTKFIALDIETGGLGQEYSILTAFFTILDPQLNTIASLELNIKPDDGVYKVSAGGLGVNGIDLVAHDERAIFQKDAKRILYDFLNVHSNNGQDKLTAIGYNIWFDVQFIWNTLLTRKSWEHHVSYHVLEVGTIAQFLFRNGWVNIRMGSLVDLAISLGLSVEDCHTAWGDVRITIDVYKKLNEFMQDALTN